MTPLAERIRHDLESKFSELDRDKLTRWQMARASRSGIVVLDCYGRELKPGLLGGDFSGSQRKVFWSFIKPCITNVIQETSDQVEKSVGNYNTSQVAATLDAVEGMLQSFVARIYGQMVHLDRKMRGGGNPNSVEPYNPAREIAESNELIARKISFLREHLVINKRAGVITVAKSFWLSNWQWTITTLLTIVALAISVMALLG